MPLPSDPGPGARAMAKQFKVLLPRSFHKLRISDELAGCFNAGDGGGEGAPEPTALVVSPFGKVWRVEVGRDGDGAFLGRGWAEFLAAHGVDLGWFVVLRHEGGGALTVKVFDTSMCIKEFGTPAAVMTSRSSKGVICKPQFIRIFHPYLSEKMILPARFVKHYITEECLNSQTAVILSPLGKFWHIELKNDQSGIFFTGGWSQFLEFHGICNGDVLLLRYEGNMVFKFKAFGISGLQKDFKNQNAGIQLNTEKQETPPPIRKRKSNDERSSSEENKRPKSSVTYPSLKEPYQIGTSSWIRKKINTYALESHLALSKKFCNSIGFRITCTITLKTEIDSTRSWQVRGAAYKGSCHIIGEGWKSFCQDNRLKTGDLCTFNIIKTTLWHVTITHSTLPDTFKQKKSPCSSSRDHKTNKGSSSSEGTKRPKSSMTSLSKVPTYTKSVYDIGPPSWIRKEMNCNSITQHLSLAQAFCNQIGLQECCTITLKTSVNSKSWQVRCQSWQKDSSCVFRLGWKKFCRENNVKVGDVCTFNVIKTTLWHVDITRRQAMVSGLGC
ncbi:putative B3 domain-containing protein Os04g0347400 [Miscanthus floridulus]|uniref:putative B3 domain-containing protein Os04g0347400 n=1 Tax=Miscanthus floridulus TaxID=154761 RepID=UPI00345951BA